MKRTVLWGLGFLLMVVVVSADASRPGPTFMGTLHVQSNFAGGGPTIVVQNKNAVGDIAIDFLSGADGQVIGNVGVITDGPGFPPLRFFILYSNPAGMPLTLAENGGNVGAGTSNPTAPFHVRANVPPGPIVNVENANPEGDIPIDFLYDGVVVGNVGVVRETAPDKPRRFFVLERNDTGLPLTLAENGGNVGIGVANPSNILTVKQGSGTDPIAGAWTTYSSRRWKTNITPIQGALDKVQRLRGVSFDWKKDGSHGIGLIAEEVGEVIPAVVAYEQNGSDARSVDYSRLVPLLIEAIKEQQNEIGELKAALKSLTKKSEETEAQSVAMRHE